MGEAIAKADLILDREVASGCVMDVLLVGGECTAWNPSRPAHVSAPESRPPRWRTEIKAGASYGPIRKRLLLFSSWWTPASKTPERCLQTAHLREVGGGHCLEPVQTQPAGFAQLVGRQRYFQRLRSCSSIQGSWLRMAGME